MSNNVSSTGFVDGVWIAGEDQVVFTTLTLPENMLGSYALEVMVDTNFPEFTCSSSHIWFHSAERYMEGEARLLEQRVANFVKDFPDAEGFAIERTVLSFSGFQVWVDKVQAKKDNMEALLKEVDLPEVKTDVPMPSVKKPYLGFVVKQWISPGYWAAHKVTSDLISNRVMEVWIDPKEDAAGVRIVMERLQVEFPTGFKGTHDNIFCIVLDKTSGIIEMMQLQIALVGTLDAINKDTPNDLSLTLFDPTGLVVKPIQPGVRVFKNEKEISSFVTEIIFTLLPKGLVDSGYVNSICAYMQGTIVGPYSFSITLSVNQSKEQIRLLLLKMFGLMDGKKWDYEIFRKHGKQNSLEHLQEMEKATKVVFSFDCSPSDRLREKLYSFFPESIRWTDESSFEIDCSIQKESPTDIATAVYAIVEGHDHKEKITVRDTINPNRGKFLSCNGPGRIPPRPDSKECDHEDAVLSAVRKNQSLDIDKAILELEQHIEQRPMDAIASEDLSNDPAIRALGVLRQTQAVARKKRINGRLWKFLVCALLLLAGVLIYQYESFIFTRGFTTVPTECSVPYGDGVLTGKRYITSEYRSLFGLRVSYDSNMKVVTKLDLPNENITLLGINPKNNKWWRMNFTKGEMGAQPLKPTDQYWFVGANKTATVSYNAFCIKG